MKRTLVLAALVITSLLAAHPSFALPSTFTANLIGVAENPPNGSLGFGFTTVTIDASAHTLQVQVNFSGLMGNTTAAHIHCCISPPGNVGVATMTPSFAGFPLGVQSGTFDNTFDTTLASSYNPPFVTAHGGTALSAELDLFTGISAGQAYFNIHTTMFPGGEIRGFLNVPEPSSFSLLVMGVMGFVAFASAARRRG